MSEPQPSPPIDPAIRLGSLALKAGLLNAEDLREALAVQAKEVSQGRAPRQLGVILLSLKLLTEVQLIRLLQEQDQLRKKPE